MTVKPSTPGTLTVVHVTTPRASTGEAGAEAAAEPEVIGRKPEDKDKPERKEKEE